MRAAKNLKEGQSPTVAYLERISNLEGQGWAFLVHSLARSKSRDYASHKNDSLKRVC